MFFHQLLRVVRGVEMRGGVRNGTDIQEQLRGLFSEEQGFVLLQWEVLRELCMNEDSKERDKNPKQARGFIKGGFE
jgi:hypothetical protein